MSIALNPHLIVALAKCEAGSSTESKLKHLVSAEYEREVAKQNYKIWRNALRGNHGSRTKIKLKPYTLKHDPSGFWSMTQIPLKVKGLDSLLEQSVKTTPCSIPCPPLCPSLDLAVSLSEKNPAISGLRATPKKRLRGHHGITSQTKRYLVGGVKLLQERYGRGSLAFHTATLPSDDTRVKIRALERSRHILKYFRKLLSNLLESKGLDKDRIVIVMELQKRNAIHFHSIFQFGTNNWNWKLTYEELDRIWKQAIVCYLPELRDADFSKSCKTVGVKKCAARYLAKYLSKDVSKQVPKEWNIQASITWYSIGKELKKEFNSKIERYRIELEEWNAVELKETLESERSSFCVKIVVVCGYGVRGINGYSELPNFLEYLLTKLSL